MAQDTAPAIVVYQGDGSNTTFSVPFDKGYYGEIKVLFVRRGLADYTYYPSEDNYVVNGRLYAWQNGGAKIYTHTPNPAIGAPTYNSSDVEQAETVSAIAGQTITVDSLVYSRAVQHDISSNLKLTWTGDTLEVGDFICIIRETQSGQPYTMPNNQKHIENALDNLERQIQEVKDATDSALKIDPSHDIPDSHKMNPIDWLKSIIRCMDFSVRALRYANGWLDYSLDDPNIDDADKTWNHLLNTENIKSIREQSYIVDGVTYYRTKYKASDGTWKTLADPRKWDNMKLTDLTDTNITRPVNGQFIMFDGLKWKNVYSSAVVYWGQVLGNLTDQTDLMNKFTEYVRTDGTSVMTAPLKFKAGSMRGAVGPYLNGVSFWKLDSQGNITNIANLTDSQFLPVTTNAIDLGRSANKWKDLYLAGKAYVATINNGYDIAVPVTNSADSFALESEITDINSKIPSQASTANQLADKNFVNSSIATNTANFIGTFNSVADLEAYSGTVTNNDYAFVVGTDSAGNTTYNRYKYTTATTPASWVYEYTLNNSSFTSDQWASINSGVTSSDVTLARSAVQPSGVGNGTITLTQGGTTKGTFTTNQGNNTTIDLDAGGSGYHPDLFDVKWADHELDDMQWLRGDTFSWQDGSVYQAAYKHLRNDMYNWYSWANNGTTIYTKKAYPELGEKAYSNSALTTEVGEITAVTDTLDITVEKITVNDVVYDSVSGSNISPTTETVGGVTVQYIPAEDGHKIVTDFHESEVADVYTATGVAWYYIIDYGFKRFKLPRTKFGFTGIRSGVDNYVAPGLPNITSTAELIATANSADNGCIKNIYSQNAPGHQSNTYALHAATIDASGSSDIYGNSDTVQPKATEMYLYFYVGNFTQAAIENTAGLNAELFNDKADLDLGNTNMIDYVVAFQKPTAGNNYTWYRKYKSGWVEQGGYGSKGETIVLPITMSDANYGVLAGFCITGSNNISYSINADSKTTTGFKIRSESSVSTNEAYWRVEGMAA